MPRKTPDRGDGEADMLTEKMQDGVGTLKLLSALIGFVILCSVLALVLLLRHMAAEQDDLAATDSTHQYEGLFNLQSRQLAVHAYDYANWDEAIQKLLVERNEKWWKANAGDYAVNSFSLSFSAVVDGQGQVLFAAQHDGILPVPFDLKVEPTFQAFVLEARSKPLLGAVADVATTGLISLRDQLHVVAAVRFRPEKDSEQTNPDPQALLLYAKSLSHSVLPVTAEIMGQPDLHVGAGARDEEIGVELRLADGSSAGFATWKHPLPGRHLVAALLPWFAALFALIASAVIFAAWRTYRLTQSLLMQAAVRESLALRNRSILEATAEGIVGLGFDGKLHFANTAAMQMLGHPPLERLGTMVREAVAAQQADWSGFFVPAGQSWNSDAVVLTRLDGQSFAAEVSITPVRRGGAPDGAVVVFRDITQRKFTEGQLFQRAHFDTLTQAPNRNLLNIHLHTTIEQASREGHSFAVFLIDIDRFKQVNDSMGHDSGDLLLKQVFERIKDCAGAAHFVARVGGDEFALVVPQVTERSQVSALAEELISKLAGLFNLEENAVWVGGSVGIAFYPHDAHSEADLLRFAEMAMYAAKKKGRGTYQFFERTMVEKILSSRLLEMDLRNACARSQFRLFYQPIINAKTQKLSHMEALIRWEDPVRGMVRPDAFIPLAEETGLIVEMGAWVLDEACKQLSAWRREGLDPKVGIAINVSGRQVPLGLPLDFVRNTLTKHAMEGGGLSFEITESVLFDGSHTVTEWLDGVRELGIHLMIDDFGTGYSSLSYLKQFRVDALKIDKGFISGVVDQQEDQSLVQAILVMSHSLGLPVIAEGVETAEQLQWLASHGCDYVQGFLLGRPAPASEQSAWINGASL